MGIFLNFHESKIVHMSFYVFIGNSEKLFNLLYYFLKALIGHRLIHPQQYQVSKKISVYMLNYLLVNGHFFGHLVLLRMYESVTNQRF